MPIAKVQLPDGRIGRFEVPEGTTPEQVQQFAASQLQAQPQQSRDQQIEQERQRLLQQQAEEVGPIEAALIGAGRGVTKIGRAVGLADPEDPLVTQAIDELKEQRPFTTGGGEILGESAPFLIPGAGVGGILAKTGAKALTKAGAAAALGALEGAAIVKGEGGDVGETLLGGGVAGVTAGALELALPVIGRIGGRVIRKALGKAPDPGTVIDAAGNPSDELLEALNREGMSFDDLVKTAQDEIATQTDDALTATAPLPKSVDKALTAAAPTVKQLKAQSRSIYKKIDDLGAEVSSNSFDSFVNSIGNKLKKSGFDKDLHPKAAVVLNRMSKDTGVSKQLSEIDTLRRLADNPAKSLDPDEKRIGNILKESFDDYLDGLKGKDFSGTEFTGIGPQYKEARGLWRKAAKSDQIHEAIDKAKDQASGFENGLRVQLRSILNSKKKSRGFKKEELAAMRKVVQGTKMANVAKFLGRFGISENQASNMLGATLGAGGGASIGAALGGAGAAGVGAVAVPAIGQVSKKLATKLTRKNSELADLVVRAGKDGAKITRAYLKKVPKSEQSTAELTQLLMRPEISLNAIKKMSPDSAFGNKMVRDALYLIDKVPTDELKQMIGLTAGALAAQQTQGAQQDGQ